MKMEKVQKDYSIFCFLKRLNNEKIELIINL